MLTGRKLSGEALARAREDKKDRQTYCENKEYEQEEDGRRIALN